MITPCTVSGMAICSAWRVARQAPLRSSHTALPTSIRALITSSRNSGLPSLLLRMACWTGAGRASTFNKFRSRVSLASGDRGRRATSM